MVILTGAVFANYDSANGYGVCKDSVKKVLYSDNFSVDFSAEIKVDDKKIYGAHLSNKFNFGGEPYMKSETTVEDATVNGGDVYYTSEVGQDNYLILSSANGYEYMYDNGKGFKKPDGLSDYIFNTDKKTTDKFIGFAESVGDIFVGDLKNNLVPISNDDGTKTYSMLLSREQMPAYVNSGISLLTSLIQRDNDFSNADNDEPRGYNEAALIMGSGEPSINDAGFIMIVDKDGNPLKIKGELNFIGYDPDGVEHTMQMNVDFDFYDYGLTEIERVSDEKISGLKENMINRYYVPTSETEMLTD